MTDRQTDICDCRVAFATENMCHESNNLTKQSESNCLIIISSILRFTKNKPKMVFTVVIFLKWHGIAKWQIMAIGSGLNIART